MSDGFLYANVEDLYPKNRHFSKEKSEKNALMRTKMLKILVAVLFAVFVVEALVYLVIIPCTAAVQVRFVGLSQYAPEELIKNYNLNIRKPWVNFDTGAISSRLAKSPLFESVRVEKIFPDQVVITVKERTTSAIALTEINGKSVAVQIDKTGYVYRIDGNVPTSNVPIISGLTFENPHPGMRLNSALRPLLKSIGELLETKPAYFNALSEIRIVPKDYGEYDLILYPMHSKIRVLADKELNEEKLQYIMVVLGVMDSLGVDVSEVDVRYGAVSYKTRNSQKTHTLSGVSLQQNSLNLGRGAAF